LTPSADFAAAQNALRRLSRDHVLVISAAQVSTLAARQASWMRDVNFNQRAAAQCTLCGRVPIDAAAMDKRTGFTTIHDELSQRRGAPSE
jgi:hypothetical protein